MEEMSGIFWMRMRVRAAGAGFDGGQLDVGEASEKRRQWEEFSGCRAVKVSLEWRGGRDVMGRMERMILRRSDVNFFGGARKQWHGRSGGLAQAVLLPLLLVIHACGTGMH